MISQISKERFRRFRSMRRAWWSLLLLGGAYLLSLLSPWLVTDRPLYLEMDGRTRFPAFVFYPGTEFGLQQSTEPDWHALMDTLQFHGREFHVLFPPIPHDPLRSRLDGAGEPPYPPSQEHWLGTDAHGRDLLSRLIHGFRICMSFALLLAVTSMLLGILLGGLQGLLGGWFDLSVQRLTEIWSALPFLYIVILLGSLFRASFGLLLAVMTLFSWVGLSYFMRGEFLKLRDVNWVRAARAAGLSRRHVFLKEILPNALSPVVTLLPFLVVGGIGALTQLDYLGFGLPPPTPSWGELLAEGLANLYAPWISIAAVVALFVTLLLAAFVGEGVREALDPRSGDRYV